MAQKRFHRHFETPGLPLYWIIIAYIILGWFFPVIGLLALICMIGPVVTSIFKGRWWCGHVCPRGNMYDRLLSKYSPHRPIPRFVRTFGFRLFMVFFIFGMFGIQLSFVPWSEGGLPMWAGIGKVFWTIIVMTTIVGVTLSFIYAPRTWCSFCPMGTISNWVATAQGIHEYPRVECLSDEVQAVRPRLPDAAHALRLSRRGCRLSASRLPEVWQVYSGLSY